MPERWIDTLPEYFRLDAAALPQNLVEALDRYFTDHIRTGGFLQRVLENDLVGSIAAADPESLAALPALCLFIRDAAPAGSWGSPTKVEAWIRAGRECDDQPG